ncbi:hypothetical protein [Actibacterium sp. MT2.3-13A]|uniref:hypothetical protein n=1 Tax=Actibacterium sp. MT2.3-13A TaxID=2828332 RepID=UPI001BA9A8A2|nr:hypothetical protein [Actibacterium sp. MT2.3-13A]
MTRFPQIKSQEAIERELRRERVLRFAEDAIGALAVFVTVFVMLWIGHGIGLN